MAPRLFLGSLPFPATAILGDLYWGSGNHELKMFAAPSYATALDNGYAEPWVTENLHFTAKSVDDVWEFNELEYGQTQGTS